MITTLTQDGIHKYPPINRVQGRLGRLGVRTTEYDGLDPMKTDEKGDGPQRAQKEHLRGVANVHVTRHKICGFGRGIGEKTLNSLWDLPIHEMLAAHIRTFPGHRGPKNGKKHDGVEQANRQDHHRCNM